METKRLGDDGGATAGVKAIRKPCTVENVNGTFGTSTVNEEGSICKEKGKENFSSSSYSSDLDGERDVLNGEERERGRRRRRRKKMEERERGIVGNKLN